LPPIEVTRAHALVASMRLALTQANSLRGQQEIVLLSVIDPQSLTHEGKLDYSYLARSC
jgi:hypothetical protein